ncbi:MAG: ABC transporter permease [Peptostreptococcaceae bacterium]|nr:ABC transporter permease [Peptostreptococcaceae bacterium]
MKTLFLLTIKSAARDFYLLLWSLAVPVGTSLLLGTLIKDPEYMKRISVGMTAVSIVFYAFSVTAYTIMAQRKRGVYSLLRVTSMGLWEYVCSVSSAWVLISVVCGIVVLSVCKAAFGFPLSLLFVAALPPVLAAAAAGYICCSFYISGKVRDEAQMSMVTNLILFPLLFCSDAFYSLEKAPSIFRMLSFINPLQWFLNGIHAALDQNAGRYLVYFGLLLVFLLGALGLSLRSFHSKDV